jgi:curli biogenesis system outer membrane secretion channel CsgG
MKPVVAVTEFENRSGFSGQWQIGSGMAELLNAALIDSDRAIVLERMDLNDVVEELDRQGNGLFREEGKVARGRLKNAQYLIRGVITDFTVTGDASGWFTHPGGSASAGRSRARVAIALKVYDVHGGEVLDVVKADGYAASGFFGGSVNYRNVAFGGDYYFKTPLGAATEEAIAKAAGRILRKLPQAPWTPRIADIISGVPYSNGGLNVGLVQDQMFYVRETARPITDPSTGNVISHIPGAVIGRVRVMALDETTATLQLLDGRANRGDYLEPIQ